jgi:hypothetical protein
VGPSPLEDLIQLNQLLEVLVTLDLLEVLEDQLYLVGPAQLNQRLEDLVDLSSPAVLVYLLDLEDQ